MKTTAAIIANPISGKDIRRLVAHGSVYDNQEKVRIVRRILISLASVGIERVLYMPEYYSIVERAYRGAEIEMELEAVPGYMHNSQEDSIAAAAYMAENEGGCIFVLGGDGTSRAVSKGNSTIPILPLSTGTNNVFPYMVEATIAGLAGGLIASGRISQEEGCFRSPTLEILDDTGKKIDMALVDVAVQLDNFIGSKAIWSMEHVSHLFMTRCAPQNIGLSAVGGQLQHILPTDGIGLHLALGKGGCSVTAPIGPGLIERVDVLKQEQMARGETVTVTDSPCVIALDGEREAEVPRGGQVTVRFSTDGPLVVDINRVMEIARKARMFVSDITGQQLE